jgi:hypothetical protein
VSCVTLTRALARSPGSPAGRSCALRLCAPGLAMRFAQYGGLQISANCMPARFQHRYASAFHHLFPSTAPSRLGSNRVAPPHKPL